MTTYISGLHDTNKQAHEDRLQRGAELGQVVLRTKTQCRAHYEGMLAELTATAHDVDA